MFVLGDHSSHCTRLNPSQTSLPNIHVSRLPIVRDLSPYVALDQVSLLDLENGTFTIPANLPPACQTLYQNVGGPNIVLNTPDFPDFAAAIQRSVSTKGCVGYKLLEAKMEEFGWEGTYLRITLGLSMVGLIIFTSRVRVIEVSDP
jgi:hypothetical protein